MVKVIGFVEWGVTDTRFWYTLFFVLLFSKKAKKFELNKDKWKVNFVFHLLETNQTNAWFYCSYMFDSILFSKFVGTGTGMIGHMHGSESNAP